MNINKDNNTVYCEKCQKEVDADTGVLVLFNQVFCLKCDNNLGYVSDWPDKYE